MKLILLAVSISLTGCAWRYGTAPIQIGGKPYDVICPDPADRREAIVGSSPCKLEPK